MSWVPPQGGAPVGPPAAPEPQPPAADPPIAPPPAAGLPAAPPPAARSVAAPATASPPTPRGEPSLTRVLTISIVGAIVISSLIGGIGTGLSQRNPPSYAPPNSTDDGGPTGDYSPLADGEPGSPVAVDPTVCDGPCFDEASAEQAIMTDEVFDDWGLTTFTHVWNMTADRTNAVAAHRDALDRWDRTGYTPDACFVTWSPSPVVEPADAEIADGLVAPLTEHSAELYSITKLTQTVRLFPDTESAERYMAAFAAGIDDCTRYHDPNGYPIDAITAEPGVHPPDSVAAVGFVQIPVSGTRYYVFDEQRGNMVIRSYAVSDGGLEERDFRILMAKQAVALDALTPAD